MKSALTLPRGPWANAQRLKGYKRDLALAALGWTVVNKAKFGEFSRSKKALRGPVQGADPARQTSLTNIPLTDFTHRFRLNLARINRLVFDNGQECTRPPRTPSRAARACPWPRWSPPPARSPG